MSKKFNNKPNSCINHEGKDIWISRSVAVAGVVLALSIESGKLYVLAAKRGPKAADFIGKMNLVCGYLDWDESGPEAMVRELYEETGFDADMVLQNGSILISDMDQPWYVASEPKQNKQNITLRYGMCFTVDSEVNLPELTTEYNEIIGEVEEPMWLSTENINNHEWAFNHNRIIETYILEIAPAFMLV